MSPAELRESYELWRGRERKAYLLWRSRQRRLDQDDPRRAEAFRAYRRAQAMRRRRREQLDRLPITKLDAAGRAELIREEGVRRYAYNDGGDPKPGHATFGVGHLIHLGPVTDEDRRKWGTPQRPLSMAVVDSVLQRDLERFERAVRDVFRGAKLKPTRNRFVACVLLAFNIGEDGFRRSSVARHIRAGNARAAADAFLLWDNPAILRPRRKRERALFLRR